MMPRQLVGTIKTIVFTLATAAALSAMADDYYWDGTASGNWSDAHWRLNNEGDATTHTFTASDKAVFTSDAEVTLTENVNIKDVEVKAKLTLLGGKNLIPQNNGNVTGTGKIILGGNTGIRSASNSSTTISVALEISSTGGKLIATHGARYGSIETTGAITGSGTLTLESEKSGTGSNYRHVTINSDMSGFTGTIADGMGYGRIMTANCSGATLRYIATTAHNYPFYPDTAYKFAAVTATIPAATESGTYSLTIGEDKTLDSSLTGDWGTLATANITFASSGTLTTECANITSLTVSNGGTVYFPSAAGIPATLSFTENGGVTVAAIDMIASVTNVLDIAENKTVTITLKGWFSFEVTAENLADSSWDWRANVTALSGVNVWTGGETGTLNDGTSTSLLVTNEVVLTIAGKHNLNGGCFLYDVTFKQTSGYLNQYGTFTGPGRIIYDGSGEMVVIRNASGTANIYNDVVFTGGTSKLATHRAQTTKFFGAVSGSGKIYAQQYDTNNTNKGYNIFAGDMSGFTGEIETAFNNSSYYIQFTDAATNLVNATVKLDSIGNGTALCGSAGTYTFGSLSGKVTGGSEAVTIVTGSGDAEAKSIAYTPGSADWTLKKEGSMLLTITGEDFASYVINGGKLATVLAQTIDGDTPTIATEVDGKIVKGEGDNVYSLKNRNPFMVIIR